MDEHLISIFNTYQAASFMLNFDKSFIKDHMQLDSSIFVNDLKIALAAYQKSTRHYPHYPRHLTIDLLAKNLKNLLNASRNLYAILTDEAKQQLETLLTQQINVSVPKKYPSLITTSESLVYD